MGALGSGGITTAPSSHYSSSLSSALQSGAPSTGLKVGHHFSLLLASPKPHAGFIFAALSFWNSGWIYPNFFRAGGYPKLFVWSKA